MKRAFLFLSIVLMSVAAMAQKNTVKAITPDTLQGAETVYFYTETFSFNWDVVSIQAACDNVGGTSDGTLSLEISVDGTDYVPFTDEANIMKGYATTGENDSLTITDGANITWLIYNAPGYKYRIKGEGTANDTTKITPKYIFK
jgi:hypothetical protein